MLSVVGIPAGGWYGVTMSIPVCMFQLNSRDGPLIHASKLLLWCLLVLWWWLFFWIELMTKLLACMSKKHSFRLSVFLGNACWPYMHQILPQLEWVNSLPTPYYTSQHDDTLYFPLHIGLVCTLCCSELRCRAISVAVDYFRTLGL